MHDILLKGTLRSDDRVNKNGNILVVLKNLNLRKKYFKLICRIREIKEITRNHSLTIEVVDDGKNTFDDQFLIDLNDHVEICDCLFNHLKNHVVNTPKIDD